MQDGSVHPDPQDQPPTGQVVVADTPVSVWARVARFVMLHRLVVLGASLVLVLLAASLVYWVGFHGQGSGTPKKTVAEQKSTAADTVKADDTQAATGSPDEKDKDKDAKSTGSTPSKSSNGSKSNATAGDASGNASGTTTSCALPSYPSASCTGVPAGTTLTVVNHNLNITVANTTISGQEIHGCITVSAPGVTIKNSKIISSCTYAIDAYGFSGAWLTVQDSEIDCGQHGGTTGIGEERVTALRNNIHGCENGFDVNGYMRIADNYIHDLYQIGGCDDPGPHTDGIQTWPDGTDITIQHNTIYAYSDTQEQCGNSAIINGATGMSNVVIKENLLAGGGYTLYCGNSNTFQVTNNHFSRKFVSTVGSYGPWTDCYDDTLSGNVYHETGLPVSPA